jgi:hypothetical protein
MRRRPLISRYIFHLAHCRDHSVYLDSCALYTHMTNTPTDLGSCAFLVA